MSRSKYSQWYADRRWREKRAYQLKAEPLCRFCKARGLLVLANVADHIEPHRGNRGRFWHGELQSLCHPCHSGTKQRLEAGKAAGCDAKGEPLDPGHHWHGEG